MLLVLGFAESSDAAEPMFAYEDREVPGTDGLWMPCGGTEESKASEGSANEAADVRLESFG